MKNSKQTKGITLIALIITIIVLLILAGVTIGIITGDNGILKNAEKAKIETRAASVEEARDVWLAEVKMAKTVGGKAKTMEEILEQLQTDGLLTKEEVEIITAQENTNNEITIGSRTISFKVSDDGVSGDTSEPDTTPPEVSIEATNITSSSVTLTVTATDNESGIKEYKYYLGEELKETLITNSYEYTELTSNTEYTIGVVVTDNTGNTSEKKTTTITTDKPTVEQKLKAGDYVNYVDKNGNTQKCIVLYDAAYNTANGTNYGVQIITAGTLGSVSMSGQSGYNNAISTLNSCAAAYLNTTYAVSARCVGSVPNNPSSESSTSTYFGKYSLKGADTNYTADFNQMGTLNIRNLGTIYCLASRAVVMSSDGRKCKVHVRILINDGGLFSGYYLYTCSASGSTESFQQSYPIRPVFTLKSEIIVTGGLGTSGDPWILGTQQEL